MNDPGITEPAPSQTIAYDHAKRLEANIASVILGRPRAIRLTLVALLAGEHVLLEDVPGVGKTLIGKAPNIKLGWLTPVPDTNRS